MTVAFVTDTANWGLHNMGETGDPGKPRRVCGFYRVLLLQTNADDWARIRLLRRLALHGAPRPERRRHLPRPGGLYRCNLPPVSSDLHNRAH